MSQVSTLSIKEAKKSQISTPRDGKCTKYSHKNQEKGPEMETLSESFRLL